MYGVRSDFGSRLRAVALRFLRMYFFGVSSTWYVIGAKKQTDALSPICFYLASWILPLTWLSFPASMAQFFFCAFVYRASASLTPPSASTTSTNHGRPATTTDNPRIEPPRYGAYDEHHCEVAGGEAAARSIYRVENHPSLRIVNQRPRGVLENNPVLL